MNTLKRWISGVLAVFYMLVPSGYGHAENEKNLNLFIWSDYITEEALTEFEAQTGIKVTVDVFDSNEMLEAKLFAGKSGYDVVVPTSEFLKRQIEGGVYRPLDKKRIPNLANLDPALMKKVEGFDPGNRHSIIYMWGTNGLGYNPEKVAEVAGSDAPVNSWDLIFDPKWAEKVSACGLYMLDSPTEVVPSALKYLGLDPNLKNAANLAKAEELLLKIRPYVTRFDSSEYVNALANGDVCVAMGFSGDVLQAAARAKEAQNGVKVQYVVPDEGAPIWFDMLAVPKDAPHPENAMAFIDHFLKPRISAQISNEIQYANANKQALSLLDTTVRNNPGIYPPDSVLDNLFIHDQVDQKTIRLLTRSWNRIKTGY